MKKYISVFVVMMLLVATLGAQTKKQESISSLSLLGQYEIPYHLSFKGTVIGGLSGIDRDSENDLYYLISDDRSAIQPARFYTAKILCSSKGIDTVIWVDTKPLLQPNGTVYPNAKQDPYHTPDPEGIRYNAQTKSLVWTSEGERAIKPDAAVLENPSIINIDLDGKYRDSFALPQQLVMHVTEKGPRQNGVLEGVTYADNCKTLFVNVEEPLYEDGPRADTHPNDAWIRIFRFDATDKKNTAQYAYHLESVAHPAKPENAFKINGVPDILSVGHNRLLVIERSFSTGILPCTIRVFLADLNGAEDITANPSLIMHPAQKPVSKKLLLNMDKLGIYTDNIEGVTFGPRLPNGHSTLLFVSDNNFSGIEKSQLLLFEIIP